MSNFQKTILLLVTVLIAGWFYWFQYRPSQIKQECNESSQLAAHEILVQRIESTFEKAETGLENGTVVNNTGKTPDELKRELIEKTDGKFDQEWYKNSYSACLHTKGL